eukprot:scaffold7317_cov79-Isochrysis_galbana.AAC.1
MSGKAHLPGTSIGGGQPQRAGGSKWGEPNIAESGRYGGSHTSRAAVERPHIARGGCGGSGVTNSRGWRLGVESTND